MSQIDKKNVILELPSMKAFDSYIEALEEGFYRGIQEVKTPEEIQTIKANPELHFKELNDQTPGEIETPSGEKFQKVPYENLWLVHEKIFIGEVSFRHRLSKFLEDFGGHIGYGIRPSYEGQGYATLAMELVKKRAKTIGIDTLMVSCSPDNPASQRVIEIAGGVFQDISPNTHGYNQVCQRFLIET